MAWKFLWRGRRSDGLNTVKYSAYVLPVPRCSHKTRHIVFKCLISVQNALLLTVLVLKFTGVLCSNGRCLYDFDLIIKYSYYIIRKVTHVQCWNCMKVTFCRYLKDEICNVSFVMFVRFGVELPTFQSITTKVSDNNKQYLLHSSAPIAITNCVWFIVLAEMLPRVKKARRENHRSPTNHAEVNKPWRYNSISPLYISLHTATSINTFAVVRQVVMNFAQRWQRQGSLYKLPTIVDR